MFTLELYLNWNIVKYDWRPFSVQLNGSIQIGTAKSEATEHSLKLYFR